MRAGVCVGLTRSNDCVYSGWAPNWLAESVWEEKFRPWIADDEHGEPGDIGSLCPRCLIERIPTSGPNRPPGWNNPKKTSLIDAFLEFPGHCWIIGGSHAIGHTHLYVFESGSLMDLFMDGEPDLDVRSHS